MLLRTVLLTLHVGGFGETSELEGVEVSAWARVFNISRRLVDAGASVSGAEPVNLGDEGVSRLVFDSCHDFHFVSSVTSRAGVLWNLGRLLAIHHRVKRSNTKKLLN